MTSLRIVEQFTFRHADNAVTTDALIDTGATTTTIPVAVAQALGLPILQQVDLRLADDSIVIGHLHRCTVAWTMYEQQGYFSMHDIVCQRGAEPIIGMDFLKQHELSVDLHHMGLIGYAPRNAEPLTGGGYVINAPKGFVRRWNGARANAAKPDDVLRPHPAWRFTHPSIEKRSPGT